MIMLFIGPLYTNLEKGGGTMDGTVGKTFWGVKAKLINVDPETKEGEVAFYTRNTFMGYIKVGPLLFGNYTLVSTHSRLRMPSCHTIPYFHVVNPAVPYHTTYHTCRPSMVMYGI